MKKLKINKILKDLIPPLNKESKTLLTEGIIKDGCRDAIITWNGVIIDGHNRYDICTANNLHFETLEMEFDNIEDVKLWMIDNQKGRRNLTDGWAFELSQLKKAILLERGREKMKTAEVGVRGGSPLSNIDKPDHNTQKVIANDLGWSTGKVAMADKVWAKAKPEIKERIKAGEVSFNKAYEDIKKEEKKQNFERKKEEFETPLREVNLNQEIILGDSVEVLTTLDNHSFDLLLSDPPYGMDFKSGWSEQDKIANDKIEDTIKIFENVLREAVPLLKDDAHFYLFGSINYMNEIKPIIEKYLNLKNILIWNRQVIGMGDLKTYGNSYDIIYFGYNNVWKDLNGNRDRDVLNFNRVTPSKNIHPTEKPLDLLEYLIKKSTKEKDKILEPFAGGGSTLLAAKNTNRLATGIEIEEKYYNLIKSRI